MVVFPNAKINIGLFVVSRRCDGFHDLETVFYPVGLSDILEIGEGSGRPGEYSFRNTGIPVDCDPAKNLIVRAYRLLADRYRLPAVRIHLHKVIPFGAGLGGGSSDAAFMLRALNEYFGLHIPEKQLSADAAGLGSDCAFFVHNRPAFASGKGDRMELLPLSLTGYHIVLIKPDFSVSTPEAYRGIVPRPATFDLRGLDRLPVTEWKDRVGNDFEKNVFQKYPSLAALKQMLYDAGAVYAAMTGSGSALYGLFAQDTKENVVCPDCFVWRGEL